MTRRYKAFISYSWADRAWGEWLHRTLETYRAPKGVADGQSLHPIFKDREEEAAGGSVGAAIEAALAASEFLIVICSPRSAQSTWVNREVAWFKTHKDKGRVLALIVDGEPGASATPGREAEECFPKTLTRKVGADLQPTEEWEDAPLAADARPEGDGRRGAKLKLAAALLGVGLDALVGRDERRRTVRRRLVTSAAFGLAAILGGLAIYAFTQRDAAVVARNEAVKARDDAEGIIELILTDLKTDLEGFGTLKSVTQIGNRAIVYYEGQDVKALTPDQLGRRARVLLMLGEADNKRGDLSAALARYETAAATTQEQLTRNPENPQRMFDHAQSVYWVGYIAWQRGDREKAGSQFKEYHDLAQKLVASDPANNEWKLELNYALSNLGALAIQEGRAEDAEAFFRGAMAISRSLAEAARQDASRLIALREDYSWLSTTMEKLGRFDDAIEFLNLESEVLDDLISVNPASASAAERKLTNKRMRARIGLSTGDIEGSLATYRELETEYDAQLARDPENTTWLQTFGATLIEYSEALLSSGDIVAAERTADAALKAAERLKALGAGVDLWTLNNHVGARQLECRIAQTNGDTRTALAILDELERDSEIRSEMESDPLARAIFEGKSETLRARILTADGDNAGARAAAARAAQSLEKFSDRLDPHHQKNLLEAYLLLGRLQDAKSLKSSLIQNGYRHPDFVALLAERH